MGKSSVGLTSEVITKYLLASYLGKMRPASTQEAGSLEGPYPGQSCCFGLVSVMQGKPQHTGITWLSVGGVIWVHWGLTVVAQEAAVRKCEAYVNQSMGF